MACYEETNFKRSRVYVSLSIGVAIAALIVLPVSGRVDVPVVIEPVAYERLFPPSSAKLLEIAAVSGCNGC